MVKYIIAKYIRLSVEDAKTDSLSVENQRRILDRYIEEMNIPNVEVLEFVDNGHSGMNFERPAMQKLLELVQLGHVNAIVVKDFSRFGRNMIENGYYIERVFPLHRVRFISVSNGFDAAEHEGSTGGLDVAFEFLIHEQYSRDLSQKIKSAKRARALRGESISKNCAFGFKKVDGRLEIDEPAAETVRLIFELYRDGRSLSEISDRLHKDKRPTPGEHKKCATHPTYLWNASHISSRLRDEQYIGTYVAGKTTCVEIGSGKTVKIDESEWIRIPDHHPAIVDKAVFEAVQGKLNLKCKPPRKRKPRARQQLNSSKNTFEDEIICSVNDFPQYLKHQVGDEVLIKQIESTKRTLYERFVLAEIGADEFRTENAALDADLNRIYS